MTPATSSAQEERRLLTLLFADLSGFTALSSKLDPEDVREVASLCFEHLNKAIIGLGGTIHKYEGDLVMALFGYPVAHEDDPERAIRASFAMFDLLPEVNKALAARLKMPTDIGLHVGINSGTVVVGEMGSSEKKEYTVMGDAVNIASRMKDLAKRGEIVVSEPVFRASRYLFEYEPREPVAVKGIDEPVRTFRPLQEKAKPESKRGIQGLTAPMVGRDREFGELKHRTEALAEGKGGAAFVLGEAGMGKSRLLGELKRWIEADGIPVALLEGRCLASSENVPYGPWLMILKSVFGVSDQDCREAVQDKILSQGKILFPAAWGDIVPYLGYLCSVRFEDGMDEKVRHLDPLTLKTQIQVSLRRLFRELARKRPLLMVIEDYHWIDPESLEFLEYLFDSPEPHPLFLLVLSRPEKEKEGYKVKGRLKEKAGANFLELVLEPLGRVAGTRLIHSLLAVPGFSGEFKDRLLSQAAGNPFYLEEILRSLIDSRILIFKEGSWLLTSEVDSFTIPDTLQAVIASRLDKLEKDVREVLQMAAVIGRSFYPSVLARLSNVPDLMLTLYLADLEEHEYLVEKKLEEGGREYAFRHPLLQEVAYSGLLKKHRRELHRRAGEAIEALFPDRLEDFTEALANQYAQGDDPVRAVRWLRAAGLRAKARYANEEAQGFFERAIECREEASAARGPELYALYQALGEVRMVRGDYQGAIAAYEGMARAGGEDKVARARTRTMIATVHQFHNRTDEALKYVEEASALLDGCSSPEAALERVRIGLLRCWFYRTKGEKERAAAEGEKALELLGTISLSALPEDLRVAADRLKSDSLNHLGLTFWNLGQFDRAREYYDRSAAQAEAMGDKWRVATALNNKGNTYLREGSDEKAVDLYLRSTALNEEIGNRPGYARMLQNLAILHRYQGDYARSEEENLKGLAILEEIGDRMAMGNGYLGLATIYKDQGDFERARRQLETAEGIFQAAGNRLGEGLAKLDLGKLALETGRREEAKTRLTQAEGMIRESGDRNILVEVLITLADLDAQGGRPASPDAIRTAESAYAMAREMGMKPFVADSLLVLGRIRAGAGDYARAEGHFLEALGIYEAIGRKRDIADVCLGYARMLKQAGEKGETVKGRAEEFLAKARTLYAELNQAHKVAECQ